MTSEAAEVVTELGAGVEPDAVETIEDVEPADVVVAGAEVIGVPDVVEAGAEVMGVPGVETGTPEAVETAVDIVGEAVVTAVDNLEEVVDTGCGVEEGPEVVTFGDAETGGPGPPEPRVDGPEET